MVCLTALFCVRDAYCQVAQKADWIFYMKSIIFLLTIWCKCDIIITEARQMIHRKRKSRVWWCFERIWADKIELRDVSHISICNFWILQLSLFFSLLYWNRACPFEGRHGFAFWRNSAEKSGDASYASALCGFILTESEKHGIMTIS